jgi:hypothetical protein
MKVQEMTQADFTEAFLFAEENEMVCDNIQKRVNAGSGRFFVAMAGDCDGADAINYWFESEADKNGYVAAIDAEIF